jgi:hypothetical protein
MEWSRRGESYDLRTAGHGHTRFVHKLPGISMLSRQREHLDNPTPYMLSKPGSGRHAAKGGDAGGTVTDRFGPSHTENPRDHEQRDHRGGITAHRQSLLSASAFSTRQKM